jgi:hypothetical protein
MFESDDELGNKLSPLETRLVEVRPEIREQGKKIRLFVTITPFEQPPNLTVKILDQDGLECSRVTLVNLLSSKVVFTMHLRAEPLPGTYKIISDLHYEETGTMDTQETQFTLPPDEMTDG